ncbi:MAG: flagellar hook-associated protein FlgK [Lachnospiraceae bacterium]|nr:flagellar hook-associated protein FlgK [Lachnospiraceae bacterium]MDE7286010.1 flagellar hook-associated protein FlgK [Lachnospiraceae bacterium]
MPSQFFGLYIAGSGLRASNAALNTTANNIANSQTTGYSRQQVTQQANLALRTFTTYGCAGAGVDTIAIERVRDTFYDMRYWDNQSKYGEYTVKQYYMRTLEDYLDDDSTSGFKTIFNQFSAALQSVTTNASSEASKKQFIASAKALTDYFNNMYGNLQELQKDINLEIKQCVDQINSISQKIATLNKQINVVELSGASANELRDQRDLLIDELSEYVDVEVEEMPIVDVYHPERETGGHRYLVRIAGGQPLVDGNSYNTLSYVARTESEKINQSDADGMYRIMWANGNEFSLQNAAMGGKLKGLAQLRDGNNGANFKGVVDSVDAGNHKVSITVDSQSLKDMKGCTLSSTGGEINIGNTLYYYTGWEFDGVDTYTFTLDDNRLPQIDAGKVGKDVKVSAEVKYQGIPYYMQQMNEWIRGFAEAVNNIFTQGVDANGNQGCIFFTGFDGTGKEYTADDFVAAGTPGVAGANGYYELTAGNFAINSALLADANLLGTRSSADVGVEECGQIKELISMLTSKDKFSFRNGTAGQMLEMLLSDMALNASNANTFYNTYNGLRNSIDNQRNSISGVDEDEEAVSLVKFQNSYTLASKMIQTLTEVYDQLILRTGV